MKYFNLFIVLHVMLNIATVEVFAKKPDPSSYTPNIYWREDVEIFYIERIDVEMWRDGRNSGIFFRNFTNLPDQCWAIQYTYVWNDESTSLGHRAGQIDPEPVIVFVSDDGNVVGVQGRFHGQWLPINTGLYSWDIVNKTHIIVAFAANVHTPGAGFLHALGLLTSGKQPEWIARVLSTNKVPNNDWVSAATRFLFEALPGIVWVTTLFPHHTTILSLLQDKDQVLQGGSRWPCGSDHGSGNHMHEISVSVS